MMLARDRSGTSLIEFGQWQREWRTHSKAWWGWQCLRQGPFLGILELLILFLILQEEGFPFPKLSYILLLSFYFGGRYDCFVPVMFKKNIARVRNCPDVTILNYIFVLCLFFCLFVNFCFVFVFLSFFWSFGLFVFFLVFLVFLVFLSFCLFAFLS